MIENGGDLDHAIADALRVDVRLPEKEKENVVIDTSEFAMTETENAEEMMGQVRWTWMRIARIEIALLLKSPKRRRNLH